MNTRSRPRKPKDSRGNVRRPPGTEKLKFVVEAESTLCSRSSHGQPERSIRLGPTSFDPAGLRLASNPESTPPPSTPAPLDADSRFFHRSRTRGATTSRFRPSSPPRRPLRGYQLQEVRPDVSSIENALHRTFRMPSAYFRSPTRPNNPVSAFRIPQNPMTKSVVSSKFRPEVRQTARRRRSS